MLRLAAGTLTLIVMLAPVAWGSASWDAAGWDSATWDSATWDAASWDSATWDSGTWDSATWDSATWDAAGWDAAGWDAAGWDSGTWDSGTWDSGTWDSGTWDSGTWDSGTWDGGQWNSRPVPPWGFAAIDPPAGWDITAPPTSQLACVVDSGIDATHPALAPYVKYTKSFIDDSIADPAGHGTHLAGLVVAVGAPQLAIAKVLDGTGHGETSDVTAAVDWCVSLDADVILLAITEDAPTKAFEKAVSRATKNAVVVASAGNAGPCEGCLSSPASLPQVLAVGAVDPALGIASFSSSGPHLDLYAPGVLIASTYPGGDWRAGSGTSQAAAFAAGAAAAVGAAHPDWSAQKVYDQLRKSAKDLDGEHAGLLDLGAALRAR